MAPKGSYESKHKRKIGGREKLEEIGFCLDTHWLFEGESWSLESQQKWRESSLSNAREEQGTLLGCCYIWSMSIL